MHLLIRGDGVAMLCVYFCEKLLNNMKRNCFWQNQGFAESGLQFGEWGYRDDVSVFQMMIKCFIEAIFRLTVRGLYNVCKEEIYVSIDCGVREVMGKSGNAI